MMRVEDRPGAVLAGIAICAAAVAAVVIAVGQFVEGDAGPLVAVAILVVGGLGLTGLLELAVRYSDRRVRAVGDAGYREKSETDGATESAFSAIGFSTSPTAVGVVVADADAGDGSAATGQRCGRSSVITRDREVGLAPIPARPHVGGRVR